MTDLSAAPARESAWEHWWDGAAEWVTGTGNTEGLGLLAFCAGWDAAAPHIRAQVYAEIRQQLAEYRFHDRCTLGDDCPEVYHCGPVLPGVTYD